MPRASSDKGPPDAPFELPERRRSMVGHAEAEAQAARLIHKQDLTNGWLITGPSGVGKATFAFRIARALLDQKTPRSAVADDSEIGLGLDLNDEPSQSTTESVETLEAYGTSKHADLIAAGAHPDVFVVRRAWNEKTQKFAQDISVDTVRALTRSLAQTPSMGAWRVAIIDTADEMNRNAANALLKVLEEPPQRTTLLLLSSQPGRLLATIRSRCRRLSLKPVDMQAIEDFLVTEGAGKGDDAKTLANAANGRPGFALALADADGAMAISAVDAFLKTAGRGGIPDAVIGKLTVKGAEDAWRLFKDLLTERITERIIMAAERGQENVSTYVDARDACIDLLLRGDALNLDRGPLLREVARLIRPIGPIVNA